MDIRKVIVEKGNRVIIRGMLDKPATEAELREEFARNKVPIIHIDVDTVGVALVLV